MAEKNTITIEALIHAPIQSVWKKWITPSDITNWCFATDDWHAPKAENDLQVGGKFTTTMAAKDGSFSFDFGGIYTVVKEYSYIEYDIEDGRTVKITFETVDNGTKVIEEFEPENQNPAEMQREGWQAILNNFKKYAES